MLSVVLLVAAHNTPMAPFQARPEIDAVGRRALADHRALVGVRQALDVVDDPLVPAADVEAVVVVPVGQTAL